MMLGLMDWAQPYCCLVYLSILHGLVFSSGAFLLSLFRPGDQYSPAKAKWCAGDTADHDHLHNQVYRYFKTRFKSKTTANSVTGLSVAMGSSGFALLSYLSNLIPLTSHLWLGVFLLQCLLYGVMFVSLGKGKITLNNSELVNATAS